MEQINNGSITTDIAGSQEYEAGNPQRKVYLNSMQDREQIQEEVLEHYKSIIFIICGNEPMGW